jgi:cell division protein FtsL
VVTNPNIGLKPSRQRGTHGPAPAGFGTIRLPPRAILRDQGGMRRRRARLRLPQPLRLDLPERLRFSAFGRLYLLLAAALAIALLYLVQAAGATQSSYEIGRLHDQQQALLAEQQNLKYQEASSKSPAQIEAAAGQANLTRPQPYRYVQYQDSGVVLDSPPPQAPDQNPLWERALASIGKTVTGSQDALAAGR